MNALDKILGEIDRLKENCFLSEFENGYAAGAVDMANAIKDVICANMGDGNDTNVPSKNGWIPVSEKLPEENDGKYYPMLNVSTSYGAVKWGFYRVRDKEWYIYSEMHGELIKAEDKEVIAWQPLPKPYKEG